MFNLTLAHLSYIKSSPSVFLANSGSLNAFRHTLDHVRVFRQANSFVLSNGAPYLIRFSEFNSFLTTPLIFRDKVMKMLENAEQLNISDTTKTTIKTSVFIRCIDKTKGGHGGGLLAQNPKLDLTLNECGFFSCISDSSGAFYVQVNSFKMSNVYISRCRARVSTMALSIVGDDSVDATATVNRITVNDNGPKKLKEEEQIIDINGVSISVQHSNFTNAREMSSNGAVEFSNTDSLSLKLCQFAENLGPGIVAFTNIQNKSTVEMINFIANKGDSAPLIELDGCLMVFLDCVFLNNRCSGIVSHENSSETIFRRCIFDDPKDEVLVDDPTLGFKKCKYNQKEPETNEVIPVMKHEAFKLIMTATFSPSSTFTPTIETQIKPTDVPTPVYNPTYNSVMFVIHRNIISVVVSFVTILFIAIRSVVQGGNREIHALARV